MQSQTAFDWFLPRKIAWIIHTAEMHILLIVWGELLHFTREKRHFLGGIADFSEGKG